MEQGLVEQIEKKNKTNCCVRLKNRMQKFDMYYFSPLFIKDNDMIDARNKGTLKALERSIA